MTGDYIGEHRGLPWSKIIVISIILLFVLRVGVFDNTKNLAQDNVSFKKIKCVAKKGEDLTSIVYFYFD